MAPLNADPADHDRSSPLNSMEGSCLCRNITIKITQQDLFDKPNGGICHCYNCRKFSGAASVNLLFLPTEKVHISDPKAFIKTYNDSNTLSRRTVPRSFCSNCGSSLGILPLGGHTKAILMPGLFPCIPEPEFEAFTRYRQGWVRSLVPEERQSGDAESFMKFNRHLLL